MLIISDMPAVKFGLAEWRLSAKAQKPPTYRSNQLQPVHDAEIGCEENWSDVKRLCARFVGSGNLGINVSFPQESR